jgi:hypothetical protein
MSKEIEVNFDDAEGATFKQGQRYKLYIDSAKEVFGKTNGTQGIELKLSAEVNGEMVDAFKHTIWLSPKALFRAQKWFIAMGLQSNGKVRVEPARLAGILLTAECAQETYNDADGKQHTATKWEDPERITIGNAPAQPEPAAAAAEAGSDDVPF